MDAVERYAQHVNPQFVRMLRTLGFDRTWTGAEGAHLIDDQGRRVLDMLGGFGMFNVGRNSPTVRRALVEALEADAAGSVQLGVSIGAGALAEALLERLPASLGRVQFANSGAEAVEAAIKFARAATGRPAVVSTNHGFHGLTMGALSANGNPEFREGFGPLLDGFDHVPFNDLEALEARLRSEDAALFLVEPVQGKGVHLPDPGYLREAQALCRRHGTLLCIDEVQTGLGRTGRMFALEHWGLEPDMVTIAKSLSGGYVPVGACAMAPDIFDRVCGTMEHAVRHGSTFAPNELAMVAGLATIEALERERLVARAERLGRLLLELTEPLADDHEIVADVRGLGLMWAIEFREPRRGRTTWRLLERGKPGLFSQLIVGPLFHQHGILTQVAGHSMNVVKVLPPLTISEADIRRFAGALEEVVAGAAKIPAAALRFAVGAGRRAVR